jgi:alpha,alpha-trehalase
MDRPQLILVPNRCDAVIFDMDGVLTDTARIHARAWKEMFDAYLAGRAGGRGEESRPFDLGDDYERYVDGRPRYEGVRSFLASRGIELEEGEPDDPPERESVSGLGNRKNQVFLGLLRREGADRFEDAVDCVHALRRAGIRTAVISASRNAPQVLERAGITELFETRIDGIVAAREGLEGKPAPDVFLEAARRLGAEPGRSAIVEDAIAGVEAGRRGGFGWVIGVAREGDAQRLVEAGADVVVGKLSEIEVAADDRERTITDLPPALDRVGAIARCIGKREPVFFLDFDGTLAPIVDRHQDASLPPQTRELLAELSSRRPVAIVSGRDLDDLRERVGLESLYYAGSHGFQLAGPGDWSREHGEARSFLPTLDLAEEQLEEALASVEGVQLERKRYAVAVHYRRAPEAAAHDARRITERVQRSCVGTRIGEGRKVLELRPAIDWDKGTALGWLLEALGLAASGSFPIYIGDDVTDEDAFRAVGKNGLAVVVRGRQGKTRASFALEDPAAVREFLARLDQELGPT